MERKTQKIQTICVFCGSSTGKDRLYMKVASSLGTLLATRKIKLVYGGGHLGLMACVANAAYLSKGKVLAIIPKPIADKNHGIPQLCDEIKVPSMHERISLMLYNADAFIALPGGLGTLEEIFCITSWAQLNLHQKPIGLLNVNGFYNGLLFFLDHCVRQEFIKPVASRNMISAPTAEKLIDLLEAYVPQLDPTLSQIKWKTKDEGSSSKDKKDDVETTL